MCFLKKGECHACRPKIVPRPNGIKEDRQDGLHGMYGDVLCTQNMCGKQGESVQVCSGAGGRRLLIVSIKASLRGAARASLYFKWTGLNCSLCALESILWCEPSHPHNCYFCCCKCARQRRVLGFFPKVYSEGFQHLMMLLIINCQKTQQK